jgi:tight adherence protein C
MSGAYDVMIGVFGDGATMMTALMVFLATAILAFGLMAAVHARSSVRRRAAGLAQYSGERDGGDPKSLRRSSQKAVQRLLDYTSKHYSAVDSGDAKVLRKRMIQAGIYDSRAVAFFFFARTLLAAGLALGAFFLVPMLVVLPNSMFWLVVMLGGILGYIGPSFYIDPASPTTRTSTARPFPTSWTSWWCVPIPGSPWKRRWSGSGASLAIPIPRFAPTST